jgi:uncharacterized protein
MLDVVVLFFLLGLLARLVKSDLSLPGALYETLSIYLLLAIGLKGGLELSRQPMAALLPQIAACMALGFVIPLVLAPLLRGVVRLNAVDAAAVAAHYGSVSVVTFAVAQAYLLRHNIPHEPHAALWVAVMEAPGIITGIILARMALKQSDARAAAIDWKSLAHDVLFGKSVLLLAGGITIGAVMGDAGVAPIKPVFEDLFKGVLALFLLELGLVAGARLGDLKRHGARLVIFALTAPLALGAVGVGVGSAMGLSVGGATLLGTLAASASYIAAPTAMRIAVPQANAALSIAAALGVTFPLNILLGVPVYLYLARAWGG